jgi:F-type H+-transporting ATPase subunit b
MLTRYLAPLAVLVCLAAGPSAGAAVAQVAGLPWSAAAVLASAPEHGAAGTGGGAADALNPLDFKANTAIWTAVVFLVLLATLWKFAWKPIAEGLDSREKRIADDIASAERANEEARKLLAQYNDRLAGADSKVRELIERGRRDAEKVGRELIDKARAETEVEKQRAVREIEAATTGALKELADRSAALAVELAGKIVQSRLDPAGHQRLIEEATSRFVHSNGGKK